MKAKWDLYLPKDTKLPQHIGIIPDGNRRWARERGFPQLVGHKVGLLDQFPDIIVSAYEMGVPEVSIWLWSTENWDRSKEEIHYLFNDIYPLFMSKFYNFAQKHKIQVTHYGRRDRLPAKMIRETDKLIEKTKKFKKNKLNLCVDYGGRDEIVRGVQEAIKKGMSADQVTEKSFGELLDTKNSNPLDLVIRTGKVQRLSGFHSWMNSYSEFYFADCYFPDFSPLKLKEAIMDFSNRGRTFGK